MGRRKKSKDSINAALGLSDNWVEITDDRQTESLESKETLSDVLLDEIAEIKKEEFGEGDYNITPYEKKLILAGFLLSQELNRMKMVNSMQEAMMHLFKNRFGGEMGEA